jgi:glycosyltransferase involved in cell wall biosynthesis
VLTADRLDDWPLDPRLLDEIPAGVQVLRVPMLNERVGQMIGTLGVTRALRRRIADSISWRLRGSDPDLFASWQPTAVRAAMSVFRDVGFDAILATGYPWTSLLVGRDLSRKTGCPLIADFRDPWAAEDLFEKPRSRALTLERTVVKQATAVITVSEGLRQLFTEVHDSEPAGKFHAFYNGFDITDLAVDAAPRSSRFRIVYTGVWKAGYGLDELYDALAMLSATNPRLHESLEVVAAGFAPGRAADRGLSALVREVGVVPHADAVSLMRSADALYLPNAAGGRQAWCMPGKLYEYLACERPVLAVTDPNGEAASLLASVGGAVVVAPCDAARLVTTIGEACLQGRLAVPPVNRERLAQYERRAITGRLGALLDSMKAA